MAPKVVVHMCLADELAYIMCQFTDVLIKPYKKKEKKYIFNKKKI